MKGEKREEHRLPSFSRLRLEGAGLQPLQASSTGQTHLLESGLSRCNCFYNIR
jgi:hypothetical protein